MVEIKIDIKEKYHLVTVNGEVDASSSIELDSAIQEASVASDNILIDLTQLEYISSAGLGVFISYLEEFKTRKVKLVLFGLKPKVREVFDILGLQHLMVIKDTMEEGMNAL